MTTPPGFARWLLGHLVSSDDRGFLLGDLDEEFALRAVRGGRSARRWYWWQVLTSIVPLTRLAMRDAGRSSGSSPGDSMWERFIDDLRSAVRASRRSALTTAAVIVTIVLGIGATTAVFSAANAVLLKPLPFSGSERVVQLSGTLRDGTTFPELAYPDLMDFRRDVGDFAALSVYSPDDMTLQHGAEPRLIHMIRVDGEYTRVFATRPLLGRLIAAADCVYGRPRVAVVSHRFWLHELGGAPSAIGQAIVLDDESYQIVGVLEDGAYTFPVTDADVLTPLVLIPGSFTSNRGAMWASAAAVLHPHAVADHAARELGLASARIAKAFPDANAGIGARLDALHDVVVGQVRPMLLLLSLTVAAVLLIACVNVANLLVVRAEARAREFAVRAALGGTPGRLRRQVLTESLLLAIIGGSVGLASAPLLVRAMVAVYPDALPRASEIVIDWRVLATATGVVLLGGLLSGWPTARRLLRLDLARDLRDRSHGSGFRAGSRAARVLIVTQVAMSFALLTSAGLLLQTFRRLTQVDPGFNPASTTTFHLYASDVRHPATHDIEQFYAAVVDSITRLPGVRAASTTTRLPFAAGGAYDVWIQQERGDQGPGRNPSGAIAVVTPDYTESLGLRIVRGREFTPGDDSSAARVVMINDVAARRFYPGVDPVGRYVLWGFGSPWRIVGVVGSTHLTSLWDTPMPLLYAPAAQAAKRSRFVVIRSDVAPGALLASIRPMLHRIDPTVALTDPHTMRERIAASLGPQRFRAVLVASLGGLALVLAILGLYGVVAYSVSQRTREIGIRMALGEGALAVRARVVGGAVQLMVAGTVAGLGLSLATGRWLAAFLIDVNPYDARALLGAGVALLVATVVAADAPARRAARVDPLVALRHE